MRLTHHARQRWAERFPHLILDEVWARSRRANKTTRRKIAARCKNYGHNALGGFKGFYYRISAEGIVFVVGAPDLIVTVFKLKD